MVKRRTNCEKCGELTNGKLCSKCYHASRKGIKRPEHSIDLKEWHKNNLYPNFKFDNVSYGALHDWIKSHKPKSLFCEKCGKITDKLDCANISGEYKRDIADFRWLCRRCHMQEDGRLNKFWRNRHG
jgi:hypothetical protein